MNARDRILGRVRSALGRDGAVPAATSEALLAHITLHAVGPRPAVDWEPLARFRSRALAASSTLDEAETLASVPEAVARYLARMNLPHSVVVWPELKPDGLAIKEAAAPPQPELKPENP